MCGFCYSSLFGGQALSITGIGFGENVTGVGVSIGSHPCDVVSVSNEEVVCVTPSATATHLINNNAYVEQCSDDTLILAIGFSPNREHEEYGLGYKWNPSSLVIHEGDTVQWSWTGSAFGTRRGVAQVNGPQDLHYNGVGFRSGQSTTGSYSHTFTKPGTYHYITEGYAHIGK